MPRVSKRVLAAGAALLAAAVATAWALAGGANEPKPLGLLTSLPIYWSESASIAETLEGGETHWVRRQLEEDFRLVPLDTLEEGELDGIERLVLAQPRALTPAENVALDAWVRAGGRLLLFADPMLTEHSRFSIGDRRRPQDVVLLSPILSHWGLDLQFDPEQGEDESTVLFQGQSIPVRLAGKLALRPSNAAGECVLAAEATIATCRLGNGEVVVIADAAVLERERSVGQASDPLAALLAASFD